MEREKALVLRSIKELEFDRAMGKVSPRDFDEMSTRLRTRAMMLIKQADEGSAGYRELIERELSARLVTRARAGTAEPHANVEPEETTELQPARSGRPRLRVLPASSAPRAAPATTATPRSASVVAHASMR